MSEHWFSKRQRIAQRLMELNPRCGHCDHWMKKSICPPESRGEEVRADRSTCPSFSEVEWVSHAREDLLDALLEAEAS